MQMGVTVPRSAQRRCRRDGTGRSTTPRYSIPLFFLPKDGGSLENGEERGERENTTPIFKHQPYTDKETADRHGVTKKNLRSRTAQTWNSEIPESVGADDELDEAGGHHGKDVGCPAEGWVPSFVAELRILNQC